MMHDVLSTGVEAETKVEIDGYDWLLCRRRRQSDLRLSLIRSMIDPWAPESSTPGPRRYSTSTR
jgi:hypothetical protein